MTRDDLEDLWSEVTETKKERRLVAVAPPGTAPTRGEGKGRREEERAFSPAEWPTIARAIHVVHQHCQACDSTTHAVDGLFVKQAKGRDSRYIAKVKFNSVELDTLPLEVHDFHRPVPHCYACILAEQLIESAMRCDLSHHQLEMPL